MTNFEKTLNFVNAINSLLQVLVFFSFQLIYNFTDGGASFSFISCNPTELKQGDRDDLEAIGVKLPSGM